MTKETKEAEQSTKVANAISSLNNADRRTIARYFDESLEEIAGDGDQEAADAGTMAVITAWLLEGRSNSLEHYDTMPLGDLTALIERLTEDE